MSIWRAVHGEVVGAWRSLRYDLTQREPGADRRDAKRASSDDTDLLYYPEYEAYERRPRRALAAGGVGLLVLGGAVGTYFAVVGGLGALLDERAAPPPDPLPAIAEDETTTPAPTTAARSATPAAARTSAPPRRRTSPVGATSPRATASPTCACVTPPVPTPTSPPPPSPSVSPSATGSSSPTSPPDPTPTDPSPTPSDGQ